MTSLISGLAFLAALVALFMIFRAVVLWYWKLDRICASLENIERLLSLMVKPEQVRPAVDKEAVESVGY